MRLELDIQLISADKKVAQKLLIKVLINGSIEFKTDWAQHRKDHVYPFFQKNFITLPYSELNYIKFEIRNQGKYIVAEKTVLNQEAKSKTQLEFKLGTDKVKLKYSLKQLLSVDDDDASISIKRKNTIQQEPQIMKNSQGKLEILKLGSIAYNFSQRLDPVIWIINELVDILSWRSPSLTIGCGVAFTLIVMNLKLSLFAAALFLMFGKNILIKKIQKINKKKNVHKRILVPKQNTVFMQNSMTTYTFLYEKIHQFCLNQDKTDVINLIHHICQASFIVFVFLFVISLQQLIVVGIWSSLLLTSPSGMKIFKEIWPSFLLLEKQTKLVTDKLSGYFKFAMGQNVTDEQQVIKQFYFYEYERWFMGKGWSKPIGLLQYHFADETAKIQLFPKAVVPDGWSWTNDYQVEYIQSGDHNGYQYTNELLNKWSAVCRFATLRRRRFVRKCRLAGKGNNKKIGSLGDLLINVDKEQLLQSQVKSQSPTKQVN